MDSIKLKFSYQRLRKQPVELHEDGGEEGVPEMRQRAQAVGSRGRGWLRLRGSPRSRRRWRPRVRIRGLRRMMRKARLVRALLGRVVNRLKEGRSHFGDLFSGNYIFMQVSPTPLGYLPEKSFMAGHGEALAPSRYYLSRIA